MVNILFTTSRLRTVSRRLLSGLLAASVLAHALLGCCWHHDHNCGLQRDGHGAAVEVSCCEHDHGGQLSHEHDQTPSTDGVCFESHGPADCESAACVAAVILPERCRANLNAWNSTLVGEVSLTGVEAAAVRLLPESRGPAAVRRHLFLQVWLA